MKNLLRRIRGAIGTGITWAAAWSGAGAVWGLLPWLVGGVFDSAVGTPLVSAATYAAVFAAMGFPAGIGFSVILGLADGRRRFDEMSIPRFAGWGALGGLLLSASAILAGSGDATAIVLIATTLGAGAAAGSLALARRADDNELLAASDDVAEVGLTEAEKRQLLGS